MIEENLDTIKGGPYFTLDSNELNPEVVIDQRYQPHLGGRVITLMKTSGAYVKKIYDFCTEKGEELLILGLGWFNDPDLKILNDDFKNAGGLLAKVIN